MYVTAGKFSKICGISKQTLIFYDKNKIFSPEKVDGNGYRYYNLNQFDIIVTIQALKSIGLSLEEIREFLQKRTSDDTYELFSQQSAHLEESVRQLQTLVEMMKI